MKLNLLQELVVKNWTVHLPNLCFTHACFAILFHSKRGCQESFLPRWLVPATPKQTLFLVRRREQQKLYVCWKYSCLQTLEFHTNKAVDIYRHFIQSPLFLLYTATSACFISYIWTANIQKCISYKQNQLLVGCNHETKSLSVQLSMDSLGFLLIILCPKVCLWANVFKPGHPHWKIRTYKIYQKTMLFRCQAVKPLYACSTQNTIVSTH